MRTWTHLLENAAGFFNGEGHSGARAIDGVYHLRLDITQHEPEVLETFRAAVGCGRVYGPYKTIHGSRWLYVAAPRDAIGVIGMLWNGLSRVKKQQAAEAMRLVKSTASRNRPGFRPTCRKGHPFDEQNTGRYVQNGWASRRCRTCSAERTAKSRRKRMTIAALLEAV